MSRPANDDGRSPLAVAMSWVHQITTVGVMMALPPVIGDWLDGIWGTAPWLVGSGGIVGFVAGMWFLLRLADPQGRGPKSGKQR